MYRQTRVKNFAGALAFAASALGLAGPVAIAPVQASDWTSNQNAGEDGHFIRIGLNKSVVIKLPAEAKDVIVGNPAIVDAVVRSKNTAYLFARATGQTNIFFFDAKGQQIMNIDLEVALDMKALQQLINRSIPGTQITVDTVDSSVVLGGTAANAVDAKLAEELAARFTGNPLQVVNSMKILGGEQVLLKVRVVEIKRDVLKQLGINIDNLAIDAGNFAFNLATSNPIGAAFGTGSMSYASSNGKFDFAANIQAMEKDGVLHMLAEPTLTAISGEVANFHAGGQFPYVTGISCSGPTGKNQFCVNQITYKDYGVKLGFTPEVLTEGRISLKINTEVSELSDVTTGALNTRSADTTLELPSGGSMMLAGLIKDTSDQEILGTPGLKNVPVLGALFRSRSYQAEQTELVVIVTPYIVNPVNEKQLASPIDRFGAATDTQAIIFGRLNQIYGAPGRKPEGVYHGNVGYIIE